ncbi:hypothetical protein SAMN06265365_105167 [Tistlia consotensis]|uniref:Uncharacterized protein n=1 Tax=Tistlia consotensis USBA 355 TaxID=560819 RepID=A0A1Y6BJ60_9PROT|nr:hypothetical protein [Tistlia consotensis]SMF13079.1 hypothetical protein SAMN05428998_105131 [Tistlia consotensis USBA 355]SNR50735.1 hypothetical protein SAMN06265365_105167 [Tistlia consotensis]
MEAELRALVSRTVAEAWQEAERSRLCFAHGAVLTITWPYSTERLDEREGLTGLVGQRLVSLSAGSGRIALEFSGGAKLAVRIVEDGAGGASGFILTTRQGELVEWRSFGDDDDDDAAA